MILALYRNSLCTVLSELPAKKSNIFLFEVLMVTLFFKIKITRKLSNRLTSSLDHSKALVKLRKNHTLKVS